MGTRAQYALTAIQITLYAATAAAGAAMPFALAYRVGVVTKGAPTFDELIAKTAQSTAEMQAAPVDEQIDKWYITSRAYLRCRPPERAYWDFVGGLRDREKVKAVLADGRCTLQYGSAPPPACGYGSCYVIATLCLSTLMAFVS